MEYVQRELPYVRSFVLRSVYGVLRQEGITFGEEEPGRVIAEWREDGTDVSLSITAEKKAFGTELTVSLRRPCDGEQVSPSCPDARLALQRRRKNADRGRRAAGQSPADCARRRQLSADRRREAGGGGRTENPI